MMGKLLFQRSVEIVPDPACCLLDLSDVDVVVAEAGVDQAQKVKLLADLWCYAGMMQLLILARAQYSQLQVQNKI